MTVAYTNRQTGDLAEVLAVESIGHSDIVTFECFGCHYSVERVPFEMWYRPLLDEVRELLAKGASPDDAVSVLAQWAEGASEAMRESLQDIATCITEPCR